MWGGRSINTGGYPERRGCSASQGPRIEALGLELLEVRR